MKLKLTNREGFLLSVFSYLRNGSDRADKKERTNKEVMEIFSSPYRLKDVDIIEDELRHYDLDWDDFEWESPRYNLDEHDLDIMLAIWERYRDVLDEFGSERGDVLHDIYKEAGEAVTNHNREEVANRNGELELISLFDYVIEYEDMDDIVEKVTGLTP